LCLDVIGPRRGQRAEAPLILDAEFFAVFANVDSDIFLAAERTFAEKCVE
jgi:hypothetical protein